MEMTLVFYASTTRNLVCSVSGLALLAGCAATPMGPTVQAMPGPGKSFATFAAEQATCKSYAADQVRGQADAANQQAFGAALLTTALGAAAGAAIGGVTGNAGAGAGIGAATGAGTGSAIGANGSANAQPGIQAQYDNAFGSCMYAKGDQVPGVAPQQVAFESARPVADPLVRSTQAELGRLGYLHAPADGFMGSRTRAAIVSYEQSNGIPPDGAASPALLAKLQGTPSHTSVANEAAPSQWVAPASANAAPQAQPASATGWVSPSQQ